jgi:predicted RNase H-like HicB family nuclease
LIAGAGGTEHEALQELRDAAHFGVDAMIDMKIKDIKR